MALQWHTKLGHVTKQTHGVLTGAMILNKNKWDGIPADVKSTLAEQIRRNTEGDAKSVRQNDEKAFQKLLARGYTATDYSAQGAKEYEAMAKTVRERMAGRVYSKELLDRVMKIAHGG